MILKDKITKTYQKANEENKKRKTAKKREDIEEAKKKAKEWADKVIEQLPIMMEEAAKNEMGRVIIKYNQNNYEGHYGEEIIQKWATKEGFKSHINGMGNGVIVEWEAKAPGVVIKRKDYEL